jgi:hypothetical protein
MARGEHAPAKHARSVRAGEVAPSYEAVSDEHIGVVRYEPAPSADWNWQKSAGLRKLWRTITRNAGALGSADFPQAASVNVKSVTGNCVVLNEPMPAARASGRWCCKCSCRRCRTPEGAEDPTSRTATGRGPVTLAFLWCDSCIGEIDQAQLDR